MQRVRHAICLTILLIFTQQTWAQKDDCEQTLKNALDEFNAGHFYGLSAILKPCINNGFTLEQQQRAYLLLTQTYLLIDDPIGAEDSYLKLLKANPEFVTDESRDPIDVVYLSKKFTSEPIFSLYGRVGTNISIARVIHDIDAYDGTNGKKERYIISPGFQLNLGGDWHIIDNFSISGGVQFMYTSYRHKTEGIFGKDDLDFHDKLSWLNIPLSIKYNSNKGVLKPFFYLGYSTNFLLTDKATITYENRDEDPDKPGGEIIKQITSPALNLKYKRRAINNAVFIGGGIKKKIGLNYWFVDLRYSFGLKNIVKVENQYANYSNDKKYKDSFAALMLYGQTEDYFRLDNLSISVGYIHPLYKPRKLKTARTKSMMRKIRKQNK